LDALPRAVLVMAVDGRIEFWNRAAEEIYGWPAADVLGRSILDVFTPASGPSVGPELVAAVRDGEVRDGEFSVVDRAGHARQIAASVRPIRDASGTVIGMIGMSEDVGAQRAAAAEAAALTNRLRLALDAGGLGTFQWDMATGVTRWDDRLEALFGLPPGGFGGDFDSWVELLHPDDREQVLAVLERAIAERGRYDVEHRVTWPDGTVRWLHGFGQVLVDDDGTVLGTIGCTSDVTARIEAELERERLGEVAAAAAARERLGRQRLEVLGAINAALADAKDIAGLIQGVVDAAIPDFADWCAIRLTPEHDDDRSAVQHVDQSRRADLSDHYGAASSPVLERLRAVMDLGQRPLRNVAEDGAMTPSSSDFPGSLGGVSSITLPLAKRGRLLGVIEFGQRVGSRHFDDDDVAAAAAMVARVASSIANMRLSDEQRRLATALQASLLPAHLPAIPGVEVAVRYWAAGEGLDVGGDFYDVFAIDESRWAVVIGDVCGKGPAAAALTGMARHTIAAAAWHGDDPITVLSALDRSMKTRNTSDFCTAVYGTLSRSGPGFEFTFACAGHPRPIIVRRDGSWSVAGTYGSLLGFGDCFDVTPTTAELSAGDVVVLYTDGITDVRPPHDLTEPELAVRAMEAASTATSADDIAERIEHGLDELLPRHLRQDDVALLVLRIAGP